MPKVVITYNRHEAVLCAKKWAMSRNPLYYDFDSDGGDCTNFISQCLYAGSRIMNYTPIYGWYYIDANHHSPSWTGVKYLYNFLMTNKKEGVFGSETPTGSMQIGDVIQLGDEFNNFYHSLFIINIDGEPTPDNIYIATHTYDSYNRALSTYSYHIHRCIHIDGVYKA